MELKNEIKLERQNDIAILHIQGDITAHSEPFINEAYSDLNVEGAVRKILLQFENEAYINSGGIAVLIQILAQTQKNDQQIGITGLSEHFKKIFRMVGITKFANIYNSIEEAMASMARDG
ncbi:MAG: anti-sigma factor antagonist [Deltaproteobacteria bacterium]|nr:anti-sigma factor antagonist [Deltaproteobacteria bacterium]